MGNSLKCSWGMYYLYKLFFYLFYVIWKIQLVIYQSLFLCTNIYMDVIVSYFDAIIAVSLIYVTMWGHFWLFNFNFSMYSCCNCRHKSNKSKCHKIEASSIYINIPMNSIHFYWFINLQKIYFKIVITNNVCNVDDNYSYYSITK